MKKHNESKIIKGIRHSKGKIICKVISFIMIFVMLFCISAHAEEKMITVRDENGIIVTVIANVTNTKTEESNIIEIVKTITIENEQIIVSEQTIKMYYNGVLFEEYNIYYDGIKVTEQYYVNTGTVRNIAENQTYIGITIEENGEVTEANSWDEVDELFNTLEKEGQNIPYRNKYENSITIIEQPAYVGFIGNARGLFDMLFESIQSLFNWLVSPNVIVFFGLGIILSLSTIGILIAKRFLWGR